MHVLLLKHLSNLRLTSMQLHELKPNTSRKTAKRIGRGGKRGKTSGKGHKGQKARAGNSSRPEMREMIKKLPKLRGHGVNRADTVNATKVRPVAVNVGVLDDVFKDGDAVNPKTLVSVGVVASRRKKAPVVKILGTGDLSKKLTVQNCQVSTSAKEKIEKAGGTVS